MPLVPRPEDFARALLSRLEIQQPADLELVASAIGLRIRKVNSTGFEGTMRRMPGRALGIVAVRAGIRGIGRERFTIAHEIGHYVLPGHGTMISVCRADGIGARVESNMHEEVAANRFATEMLLPSRQIKVIVSERSISIKTAKYVANKFKTSLTAAALQCVAVANCACAVVVSIDGMVNYYKASESWSYSIPVGCTLGKGTVAASLDFFVNEATGVVSTVAWTARGRIVPETEIVENSIYLPPYNMTLTILTSIVS